MNGWPRPARPPTEGKTIKEKKELHRVHAHGKFEKERASRSHSAWTRCLYAVARRMTPGKQEFAQQAAVVLLLLTLVPSRVRAQFHLLPSDAFPSAQAAAWRSTQ